MHFKRNYFFLFMVSLIIALLIAFFSENHFIRFIFGDGLVAVMLYGLFRSFFKTTVLNASIVVFVFCLLVEISQLFKFTELMGLEQNTFTELVFGTTFSVIDILAYALGIIIVATIDSRTQHIPSHSRGYY